MMTASMSQFADFMRSTGAARFTEARSHGGQPFDLYAAWKATVLGRLARGEPLGTPAEMWPELEGDAKKAKRYPVLLGGMKTWLSLTRHPIGAVTAAYPLALPGVTVRVTPEIALLGDGGSPTLIKLYLRTACLTPARAHMLCALMDLAVTATGSPRDTSVAVLDVARVRLHYGGTPATMAKVREVLHADALAYAALRGGR